jgi:anti-anti-sigma factor
MRRAVRRWAPASGLPDEATDDLLLALEEATGNAVEHAYRDAAVPGRVIVELRPDDAAGIVVSVSDTGTWRPPPADPGFRGRGLQIISTLAHDVDLAPGPGGTTLRFVFTPTAPPELSRGRRTVPRMPVTQPPADQPAAVDVTDVAGRRCLALTGDLDLAGTTAIRELVLTELAEPRPITVDLTRLGFVTSAGGGLLLEVADRGRTHGDLDVVLPTTGPARRMLDLTGLASALQPEADRPR